MRFGQCCTGICEGVDKCKKIPGSNVFNIVELPCVVCNGQNFDKCEYCGKTGQIKIIGCPEQIITSDIWDMIELAKFYQKGLPPIAGGVLDQTHNFIAAANFIFAEENIWKAKLGIEN